MNKKVIYALGGVALVIGLWGFYDRFVSGHANANYGSYVVWGLWVAMYLFFAGVAAGSYMLATMDYLFEIPLFKGTGRVMLWAAMITLPAALTSIGLDLGHMERIYKVYMRPNLLSVMAQMVWGYTIFGGVILASLIVAIRFPERKKLLKPLMVVGLLFSIFLSGGVGALLGVNASRAYWHVGLLPAQFPVFSLASGAAMMLIVMGWFAPPDERRRQQLWVLSLLTVSLAVIKLYFLWTDFSQSLYGQVPHNVEAVNQVLFGRYWWAFWIIQIALGTLLPIIVLLQRHLSWNGAVAGWMGLLVLLGFTAARANIVFPALTVPELAELRWAFSGPHLTFDYFPSLMEWAVTLGIVGGATLVFLLGLELGC